MGDTCKIWKKDGKLLGTHSLPLDGAQDEQLGPGLLQQRYLLSNKNDCCKVLIKHSSRLFIDFFLDICNYNLPNVLPNIR